MKPDSASVNEVKNILEKQLKQSVDPKGKAASPTEVNSSRVEAVKLQSLREEVEPAVHIRYYPEVWRGSRASE